MGAETSVKSLFTPPAIAISPVPPITARVRDTPFLSVAEGLVSSPITSRSGRIAPPSTNRKIPFARTYPYGDRLHEGNQGKGGASPHAPPIFRGIPRLRELLTPHG